MGLSTTYGNAFVTVHATGEFTLAEIRETFAAIRARASAQQPVRILIRDPGSSFAPRMEGVRSLASLWREVFTDSRARISLLVTKDHQFGIGRQAEAFTQGSTVDVAVFRDETEALSWLVTSVDAP